MPETDKKTETKTKDRSPNFPAISLKEAIERVKMLYDADKMAGSSHDSAFKHLGYSGSNGASLGILGALRQFDLIREENKRIFVSDKARTILLLPENDERRIKAIKSCALSPKKFSEIWNKYIETGLPSDETIKTDLVFEGGFNEKSAQRFIFAFKQTLDFAGIKEGDATEDNGNGIDKEKDNETDSFSERVDKTKNLIKHVKRMASTENAIVKEYEIPRKGNKLAVIQLEKPLSVADYENIKNWLELFKDTLIDEQPGKVIYKSDDENYEGKKIADDETTKEHFGK